jgi:hypothetical protein
MVVQDDLGQARDAAGDRGADDMPSWLCLSLRSLCLRSKALTTACAGAGCYGCCRMIWDKHATPLGIVALIVCLLGGCFYKQAPMRATKAKSPRSAKEVRSTKSSGVHDMIRGYRQDSTLS